jgi:hypothetical protein
LYSGFRLCEKEKGHSIMMGDAAMNALAAARAAGIVLSLDGDRIAATTATGPVPVEVLDLLKAVKPDLVRVLKREAAAGVDLVDAVASYFASRRWWRGPAGALFTVVGHPFGQDEDEAVLADLLTGAGDAFAERGIVMDISCGYVTLSRPEPDLAERIVAYMTDRMQVSFFPARLLTEMNQPIREDESILLDEIMMLEDDLVGRGIALRYEPASGHVVLDHCIPRAAEVQHIVPRRHNLWPAKARTIERRCSPLSLAPVQPVSRYSWRTAG